MGCQTPPISPVARGWASRASARGLHRRDAHQLVATKRIRRQVARDLWARSTNSSTTPWQGVTGMHVRRLSNEPAGVSLLIYVWGCIRPLRKVNLARGLEQRRAQAEPTILRQGPGYVVASKPAGLSPLSCVRRRGPSLQAWLREQGPDAKCADMPQARGQLELATSGAVFAATSRAAAAEAAALWAALRMAEVYTAVLRGHLPLGDTIRCHRRLCKPSEGSWAWRLAGNHQEGREACTLARGLRHGRFDGEPCTLAELRPVTSVPQQLKLHCVALGHPIVGDVMHGSDRRLDFRFERPLDAPRLMLHCWQLRIPLAAGSVLASAPDVLGSLLQGLRGDSASAAEGALLGAEVEGLAASLEEPTQVQCNISVASRIRCPMVGRYVPLGLYTLPSEPQPDCKHISCRWSVDTQDSSRPNAWDAFAGGLPERIVDASPWDNPASFRLGAKGKYNRKPIGHLRWKYMWK